MNDQPSERSALIEDDIDVPRRLASAHFVLEPLTGSHNVADHAAWTSSIEHIRSSPGFGPHRDWPADGMSLAENLRDLERHDQDFQERTGFTFTVLDPERPTEVIGCVYMYPDQTGEREIEIRSWVTAARADLDIPLREAVVAWLHDAWPFTSVRYAGVVGAPGNDST